MATRLLLLSDTHVPARDLPAAVWAEVDAADVVVHAGDWTSARMLDALEARAARLVGVYGNNDHGVLRERLPEVARVTIDGVRVAVVHETGGRDRRELRMDAAFPDADLLVFGHSHIPWHSTTPAGLRLLNPGSPTDRRRQPHATVIAAHPRCRRDRRPRADRGGTVTGPLDWIAARRAELLRELGTTDRRLDQVREARGDWIDEEHDPEGFSLTFEWQHAEGQHAAAVAELRALDEAEARVAAGTYGVCARCGMPIPEGQLELRPARTQCVACTDARRR